MAFSSSLWGQNSDKFTISGEVRDSTSGETIVGAVIQIAELKKGITTNAFGFYSLTAPKGTYTIKISFIGYREFSSTINLNKDTRLDVTLSDSKGITGKELVIEAERKRNTESTDMGRIEIPIEQIKKLPVVFGEVDILKTIARF